MKTLFTKICLLATILCLVLSFIACDVSSSSTSETTSTPASESASELESPESASELESKSESSLAASLVTVVDNMVIITVDADYMAIGQTTVLIDYMTKLKADGVLDFTVSKDGMISSINGQENPADWSKCWMLYSDDAELTNQAWGTATVGGKTYFSAVLGAESLPIKDGKIYVWEFKSF